MSLGWIFFFIILAVGIVVGNVLLLRSSKKFNVPKDFVARKYDDDDD